MAVLLPLLSSAAAPQYRWQAAIYPRGPAVRTVSGQSAIGCALRCEALPLERCSGFIYQTDADRCRLFSGDCRGPAANSSLKTDGRYMARRNSSGKGYPIGQSPR